MKFPKILENKLKSKNKKTIIEKSDPFTGQNQIKPENKGF